MFIRIEKKADIPIDSKVRPEDTITLTIDKEALINLVGAKDPQKANALRKLQVKEMLHAIVQEVAEATSLNNPYYQAQKLKEMYHEFNEKIGDGLTREEFFQLLGSKVEQFEILAELDGEIPKIVDASNKKDAGE
jgi:hypothetical protein